MVAIPEALKALEAAQKRFYPQVLAKGYVEVG
jgi:hypothetical protein